MGVADLGKMIGCRQDTEYGPDIEAQLIRRISSAVIDDALKDNMVRTFDRIMEFVNDGGLLNAARAVGSVQRQTIIRSGTAPQARDDASTACCPSVSWPEWSSRSSPASDVSLVTDTLWTWGVSYSILREAMFDILVRPDRGRRRPRRKQGRRPNRSRPHRQVRRPDPNRTGEPHRACPAHAGRDPEGTRSLRLGAGARSGTIRSGPRSASQESQRQLQARATILGLKSTRPAS